MSGGVPAGELLPCPFCGSAAEILENPSERPDTTVTGRYFVRCSPCDLIIDSAWDVPYDDAVRAWNTRATPTSPIEGRDADVERENMRWFSDQRRLSLDFYSPMYGDDDDQTEEWRVTQESGSINDREWDVVGRGDTAFAAVAAARATLTPEAPYAD